MRFRELEPGLHREPGQSMRQHRACPLRCHERRSGSRTLPLGDCEPRRDRQQDRGHDVVRRRYVLDERAGQGELRLCRGEIAALQRQERPLGARDHAGPGRSAGDGRVRSLDPGWPPLGRALPRTASPSRAGGWRRGTTGSCRAGGTTRARRRSASARRRPCRARREPWPPRSRGGSRPASGPRTRPFRPPAPNARRLPAGRATRAPRPPARRSRGYRSSRSESSNCASQRSTVVTRPLR